MGNNPDSLQCFHLDHSLTAVTLFGVKTRDAVTIIALCFGRKNELNGKKARRSSDPMMRVHATSVIGFLNGNRRDLSGIPIDLSSCTPFERKVLRAARAIPWGQVISYAELARRAGSPFAVRAAASVMRRNRFPLIVPCHRVIRSDGSIGGFMGEQEGKWIRLKKRLLEREWQ